MAARAREWRRALVRVIIVSNFTARPGLAQATQFEALNAEMYLKQIRGSAAREWLLMLSLITHWPARLFIINMINDARMACRAQHLGVGCSFRSCVREANEWIIQ